MVKILIVEDERLIARYIQKTLEQYGYEVTGIADTGEKAITQAQIQIPSLILMDIKLNGPIDGIETAKRIRARNNLPVIFLSAYSDENILNRAKAAEAFGYLLKPFNERMLRITIEMALYRNQMVARLQESEERYRTLFESSREGIVAVRPDGSILEFNPAFARLLGFEPTEFRDALMNPPPRKKIHQDFFKQLLELQCTTEFEKDFTRKDGTAFPVLLKPWKLFDSTGEVIGAWFIVKDISKQKFIEAEKDRLMEYALEITRLKEKFKQKITEEFLEPLVVFRDWFERYAHPPVISSLSDNTRKIEDDKILASLQSLFKTINTIVQSRDIQEGRFSPEFHRLSVSSIIKSAILAIDSMAFEKNVEVRFMDIYQEVHADPYQLKQAFIQILSNAVKFSHSNSVVDVQIVASREDPTKIIQVEIVDQGLGFTPQELAMVFQEFGSIYTEQEQKLALRGAGFGLFISRQIIEIHGGEIEIESCGANQGTTVTIKLPVASVLREE